MKIEVKEHSWFSTGLFSTNVIDRATATTRSSDTHIEAMDMSILGGRCLLDQLSLVPIVVRDIAIGLEAKIGKAAG